MKWAHPASRAVTNGIILPPGKSSSTKALKQTEVYIIVSGGVEFLLNDAPIGMDGEGGIVGEMALINETVRSATARARTDCSLDTINRERFLALIEKSPPFALHVMRVMADRLRLINELVSSRG